jgi:hypothetical protein
MALAQCLISYASKNSEKLTLDELAEDFFEIYIERTRGGKPQNAQLGKKTYVEQEIDSVIHAGKSKQKAIDIVRTQSLQNMVLRKFHNLNNREIPQRFYTISSDNRYLILDNTLFKLFFEDDDNGNNNQSQFMRNEIDARWDLLEHAFENIHNVESLDVDQYLEHVIRKERRTNLTKLVHLLEGYQRGRCFYCNEPLHEEIAVDHVIPYQALMHNQFWNLVLADTFCNENKSDNIAPLHYIENLIARNEFFISSAHPLKDTLLRELGYTQLQRRQRVMKEYSYAKGKIVRIWGGSDKYDPSKDPFYRSWVNFLG